MRRGNDRSRIAVRALTAMPVLAIALLVGGCQDLFNAVFDNPAPMGVSASDGDYASSVYVSWGAPSLSSDKWKDYSVSHYELSWRWDNGDTGNNSFVTSTNFSIDASSHTAMYCDVTVESWITKGGFATSGGSASDKGFALDAEVMTWPDGGKTLNITGSDRWYETSLQSQFGYSFEFSTGTGVVEFYKYKTLDLEASVSQSGATALWVANSHGVGSSNKFYVHVIPSAAGSSFLARYWP